MASGEKVLGKFTDKVGGTAGEPKSVRHTETKEEMDQRLLGLLGEVIRMSQAWARALESGDPFTADKCEAECIAAMERFEVSRKRALASTDSLEKTQ